MNEELNTIMCYGLLECISNKNDSEMKGNGVDRKGSIVLVNILNQF